MPKPIGANVKYPHSAVLFKFCKEALRIKFDGQVKVIDQDVGAILKYDPADCSHWKRGSKNIRNLTHLRDIAQHFKIDEGIPVGIMDGSLSFDEALFEYTGYGSYTLDSKQLDALKKDFFEKPYHWDASDEGKSFEEIFKIRRKSVRDIAHKIIEMGAFSEPIIDLKEVSDLFSNIKIQQNKKIEEPLRVSNDGWKKNLRRIISHKKPLTCPYMRFLMAREIFYFLKDSEHELMAEVLTIPPETATVHGNIFASYLLIPDHLLREEVAQIFSDQDIIQQLAQAFGVSKALINHRLWNLEPLSKPQT